MDPLKEATKLYKARWAQADRSPERQPSSLQSSCWHLRCELCPPPRCSPPASPPAGGHQALKPVPAVLPVRRRVGARHAALRARRAAVQGGCCLPQGNCGAFLCPSISTPPCPALQPDVLPVPALPALCSKPETMAWPSSAWRRRPRGRSGKSRGGTRRRTWRRRVGTACTWGPLL